MASTSGNLMRRLQKVLQKWPVTPSRKGRDLGEHLRNNYKDQFKKLVETDPEKSLREIQSLEKLASNHYRELYKREKDYAFSGDILLKHPDILSNDNLKEINKERPSFWRSLINWRK